MTDTDVATEEGTIIKVPCVKGKETRDAKTGLFPDHVYREILAQGIKVLANRGMTKITKEAYPNPEELRAAAMAKFDENLQAMYDGKIRIMGGKADKVPGVVMTEARRIARNLIKEELKRSGVKVSYVEASEITKYANSLLAADPSIIEQAREELEKRAATKVKVDLGGIAISQKKLKAAEERKAEKVLSAAKAGKVVTRARPQPTQ